MNTAADVREPEFHDPPPAPRKGWLLTYPTLVAVIVAMVGFGVAILGFIFSLKQQASSAIDEAQAVKAELVQTRADLSMARNQLASLQAQNLCRSQLNADNGRATLAVNVALGQLVQALEVQRTNPEAYPVASQSFDEAVASANTQYAKSVDVDKQCPPSP